MTSSILAARNLSKVVSSAEGELTILHGLDLSLEKGDSLAIVGSSGSGKSTLLGLLAGLDLPTGGCVLLAGKDLSEVVVGATRSGGFWRANVHSRQVDGFFTWRAALPGQQITYTVTAQGRLVEPEQFGEIVLRSGGASGVLRLKDVARIELGAQGYATSARLNGKPSVGMGVQLSPTGNALAAAIYPTHIRATGVGWALGCHGMPKHVDCPVMPDNPP